jgi:hypothetical protein
MLHVSIVVAAKAIAQADDVTLRPPQQVIHSEASRFVAAASKSSPSKPKANFMIVSWARSGTTWVDEMLNTHTPMSEARKTMFANAFAPPQPPLLPYGAPPAAPPPPPPPMAPCDISTDNPSPWMSQHSLQCDTWQHLQSNSSRLCSNWQYWVWGCYCANTCHSLGQGYAKERTESEPTYVPEDVGAWGEVLLDEDWRNPRPPSELKKNLKGFLDRKLDDFAYGKGASWGTHDARQRLLDRPIQGFKWFNTQGGIDLAMYNKSVDMLQHPMSAEAIQQRRESREIFASFLKEGEVSVVMLERSNLARFVSELKMTETGTSVCDSRECQNTFRETKVKIDPKLAVKHAICETHMWQEVNRFFEKNVPPERRYHFKYEDLCATPQHYMNGIGDLLGLDEFEYVIDDTRKMDKVETLRDTLQNPDEIAAALVGTPWEGQVDEQMPCGAPAGPQSDA